MKKIIFPLLLLLSACGHDNAHVVPGVKPVVIPANSTITKFIESLVGDSSGNAELKVRYGNFIVPSFLP
jgi:hypothetical protein